LLPSTISGTPEFSQRPGAARDNPAVLALRRTALAAALAACAGCVLFLRHLVFRETVPFPKLEEWLGRRIGPFADRMQFSQALPCALLALLAVAVLALVLAWKSLGLPSPARDVRLDGPEHAFFVRGAPARAFLAAFTAAEAVLVVLILRGSIPAVWLWTVGLVALAALAACADRSSVPRAKGGPAAGPAEVAGVLVLAAACAAVAGYRLNGWEWAGSEDSYGFYGVARELYEGVRNAPFLSPDGVYGLYSVASSWLQALLFPVLGPTGEALRAGNLVLVAALAVLGHVFARPLIGRVGAFATAALLGSSVLVQTYAKVGYNNLQGVVFAMLALTLASRAAATRRWTPLVLSGMAAGAGLFSYALAAISGAAVLLWLALSGRPSKRSFRAAAVFGLASLAAAAPCLLSRHYVDAHLIKLSVFSPELSEDAPARTPVASRLLHTLAQPAYNRDPAHAAAGPRLDPVSAVLLLVGIAALAGGAGARTASRALLALALFWPVSIGLLQPYAHTTSPWVLLATPAWAFLGGCGVAALGASLPLARAAGVVALATLSAAAAWSMWQVHVTSFVAAPLPPLAFTVAAARAAGVSGLPTVLVVPAASSGDGAPIVEAVKNAGVPSVRVETPAFGDESLRARLETLREKPAILVLYEIGAPFPPRDRLRDSVREAWPGAHEVFYRALATRTAEPSVRVFVNPRASGAEPLLPARNRSEK
jgi:hypothetical protein